MFNEAIKQKLLQDVIKGVIYERLDSNGMALGCMYPIYEVYPEATNLRFPPPTGHMDMKIYMTNLFDKYCSKVPISELAAGDIVTINMPFNLFHVGVYLGDDKLVHSSQHAGLELVKFAVYKNRIEGGYRYIWQ